MPKSRSTPVTSSAKPSSAKRSTPAAEKASAPSLRERADALYRAALECCHQHERYARVVTSEVDAGEERAVSRVVGLCDEHLRTAMEAYERAASTNGRQPHDDWHRGANALWLASREWVRRHASGEEATRRLSRHTPEKLGELAVEYDLEASALLALQHALADYRRVAPDADLNGRR